MSEKMKLVPVEPTETLLRSMAMRYRHDFGLLEPDEQASIMTNMRQIHEEVVGLGFYQSAAPSQEGEPVSDERIAEIYEEVTSYPLSDEDWHSVIAFARAVAQSSSPTAEQAAADMKLRMLAKIPGLIQDGYSDLDDEYSLQVFLAELESLPTSDTAMEEMRGDDLVVAFNAASELSLVQALEQSLDEVLLRYGFSKTGTSKGDSATFRYRQFAVCGNSDAAIAAEKEK